jgi:hypothetical protein
VVLEDQSGGLLQPSQYAAVNVVEINLFKSICCGVSGFGTINAQ